MAFFLCRLIPPRPTFAQDMNAEERGAMQAHAAYLTGLAEERKAVAFGLVLDPAGSWGLGLFEVENEAEIHSITNNDPAIRAAVGLRYEVLPMPRLVTRDHP